MCDVTFKAAAKNQRVGNKVFAKYQPVFMIDTARTSTLEQASATVYAQGGRGFARLLAWEGEKTMTFTVEDALMSPMGLAVLTSAGLINHKVGDSARVHVTLEKEVEDANGTIKVTLADLQEETGLDNATSFTVCDCIPMYATVVGSSGKIVDFLEVEDLAAAAVVNSTTPATLTLKVPADAAAQGATLANYDGKTVIVDFYLAMTNNVQTITIGAEDFGGYYYVEAQTLFRDEATGKDLAANITFPKVKIQSAFTFTMGASGDPSTFSFVMDAFPGYTITRCTEKTMCDMQIISPEAEDDSCLACDVTKPESATPSFPEPDTELDISASTKVGTSTIPTGFAHATEYQANQNAATVTVSGDAIDVAVSSVSALNQWPSTDPGQSGDAAWIALDIATGTNDITKLTYNGSALTSGDVADAAAWGLGAGHIILWIRADQVVSSAKTIVLGGTGYVTKNITITVTETVSV